MINVCFVIPMRLLESLDCKTYIGSSLSDAGISPKLSTVSIRSVTSNELVYLSKLTRQSTPKPNEQVDQEYDNKAQQHHQLDILPPHPPLQRPRSDPEIPRVISQSARLVHQDVHVLAALQDSLNVLRHDLPHALDLTLRSAQSISLSGLGRALLDHQLLKCSIEARTSVGRQVGEVRLFKREGGKELLLEVRQEAEGDTLAQVTLGDHEEGKAAGAAPARGEVRG